MIVKTYPNPSGRYRETVCTAGITEGGEWVRLYPLAYRNLKDEQQFKKYTWIEVEAFKSNKDNRPESYRVDESTLKVLRWVDSQKGTIERKKCYYHYVEIHWKKLKSYTIKNMYL